MKVAIFSTLVHCARYPMLHMHEGYAQLTMQHIKMQKE